MSVKFEYHEEGSIKSYVKVIADGEDHNGDDATVIEAITPQELLRFAAELIDKNPYYKDIFDKRLF
jgi:hypothetical protein